MKKALINPKQTASHIVSWNGKNPVTEEYPNSQMVCDVCSAEFDVASPLFWLDCQDDVTAYNFYFDSATIEIMPIVNAEPTNIIVNDEPTIGLETI